MGRQSLRSSARLVEKALELGIRYFDVAPSYGFGTADEVLGEVIGDSTEVTIATKVGPPRPVYSPTTDRIRVLAKRVLGALGPLKRAALAAQAATRPNERPRWDFSAAAQKATLEQSLRNLRRSAVDVYLAHEPRREDLTEEVVAGFEALRNQGLIRAFGAGMATAEDRWIRFGSIWQSAWPGAAAAAGYSTDMAHVWHGAIRHSPQGSGTSPAAVGRAVLDQSPGSSLLVSASTPRRLEELLREVG